MKYANKIFAMKRTLLICFAVLIPVLSFGQDQKKITLSGYITSLQSAMFDSLAGPVIYDNLLHNRLNFKGYLSESITVAAEFRNRLFMGDMVRSGASYATQTGKDNGVVDMSWNLINEPSFFLNTTIDRLWFDYNSGKWQVRVGRQRINWGQTFVWNPNDIFNAYSFFDFDYTERPGSDAVRIQYYSSASSTAEIAVKIDSDADVTAAALYKFNKGGYDIQLLGGVSNSSDIVAGAGWSGAIGTVGFRGEGSWFRPLKNFSDTTGVLTITTGIDKVFGNNSSFQFQIMYCNNPLQFSDFGSFYSGDLTAKELAFSEFSLFSQFSYSISPLATASLSAMWFPDLNGFFAGPSFDYSLAENVDFSLLWQHFTSKPADERQRMNLVFLRLRYSF